MRPHVVLEQGALAEWEAMAEALRQHPLGRAHGFYRCYDALLRASVACREAPSSRPRRCAKASR
jgi:hypothetical protein